LVTGRKLLLADDSVTIQKVIDLTFADEGIEVTTVDNGEQAISKLDEIEPDIVLADIFMPGRSGYEVCEHIKRDERYRHIPVLLLVGSFEPFDEAEARRVGADDYLTKPFQSIRQLVNKVTSLISGAQAEDEASTRDLELPKEMAEKEPVDGSADIYTADTAPLPKELEGAEPSEAAARLAGHESLDDEMIETRTPGEVVEAHEISPPDEALPAAPPPSFAEAREAEILTTQEDQPEPFQETIRDFKIDEMNEEPLSTETESRTTGRYMSNATAADEALLDLGDIEPPMSTTEADDFILDLQDDVPSARPFSPPGGATSSAASETAQPEIEAAGAPASFGFSPAAAGTPAPQFSEDFSLVSPEAAEASATYTAETAATEAYTAEEPVSILSPVGEEDQSQASAPRAVSYPLEERTETALPGSVVREEEGASVPEAAASAEVASRTGQITLDQLSPEAIDAIARRAVELLSTKVVEEIAWEVVPQLAELLIKRRLEEGKSQ
jgi:CheY-like chemotaxis protein